MLGKIFPDVRVRDNGATVAELQARAFAAELLQKNRRDFYHVTAISKLDGNGAHGRRIKIEWELRNKKARAILFTKA